MCVDKISMNYLVEEKNLVKMLVHLRNEDIYAKKKVRLRDREYL